MRLVLGNSETLAGLNCGTMLDAEISRSLVRATSESLYDYCFMQSERQKESSSFKSPVELIERKRETDALLIDLRTQGMSRLWCLKTCYVSTEQVFSTIFAGTVDALESDIAYDQQDINVMKVWEVLCRCRP